MLPFTALLVMLIVELGTFDAYKIRLENFDIQRPLGYKIVKASHDFVELSTACGLKLNCAKYYHFNDKNMTQHFELIFKNIKNDVASVSILKYPNKYQAVLLSSFGPFDRSNEKCYIRQEECTILHTQTCFQHKILLPEQRMEVSVVSNDKDTTLGIIKNICDFN